MIEELKTALRDCVRALNAHIKDEAQRNGVTVQELCPCKTNEIKRAEELLSRAE